MPLAHLLLGLGLPGIALAVGIGALLQCPAVAGLFRAAVTGAPPRPATPERARAEDREEPLSAK